MGNLFILGFLHFYYFVCFLYDSLALENIGDFYEGGILFYTLIQATNLGYVVESDSDIGYVCWGMQRL